MLFVDYQAVDFSRNIKNSQLYWRLIFDVFFIRNKNKIKLQKYYET